jgi:hypothetical protein
MKSSFIVILFFSVFGTFSQSLSHTQQYWIGYMTQGKINENWYVWNDSHWVPDSFFLLRTGVTHRFKSKHQLTATAGFAKLWIYPSQPNLNTFRPENRPWGQLVFQHQSTMFKHMHRLRIDARFRRNTLNDELLPGYDFNWRIRYLYQIRYDFNQLNKENYFFSTASNEILYNLGANIQNHLRLDQNRFQLAIGYQHKKLAFQLGYMNFMTLNGQKNDLTMKHTLTTWVFHQFDF